jgi:hypothetical protein
MAMGRVHPRNNAIFDKWSIVHLATGIVFGLLIQPLLALAIMVLWEPLEIFVLSPLLAKIGIEFGYETWRNSLSDIAFDVIGVMLGYFALSQWLEFPFRLFG